MKQANFYQTALIALGILCTVLMLLFFYAEFFPEYLIYQKDYVALEDFRSSYMGEPPPDFQEGVKQIVIAREDLGPPLIDRCTSCHVALEFEHFSPTILDRDINGTIRVDAEGRPVTIPNENYVWGRLDQKIAQLEDKQENERLAAEGKNRQVKKRLKQAKKYRKLKTAQVGEHTYDVTKVLRMHPLMGRETRPFEYHPIEEYGCTSCHNGNGRGLTTEKAHGPVFDGSYEAEVLVHQPQFLAKDPENDPAFAYVFNYKPGDALLFQTTPIFVGALIQAKCVQCHQSSPQALSTFVESANLLTNKKSSRIEELRSSLQEDEKAVATLIALRKKVEEKGYSETLKSLKDAVDGGDGTAEELRKKAAQVVFLETAVAQEKKPTEQTALALSAIDRQLQTYFGSDYQLQELLKATMNNKKPTQKIVRAFVNAYANEGKGPLFHKAQTVDLDQALIEHVKDMQSSLSTITEDQEAIGAIVSDVDALTATYHQGKQLFFTQACYACHRIAGLARGGIGPELTNEGTSYPWFVKESIVWPQADLKTSTMPNYHLDHVELEALVTFLLGQFAPSNKAQQNIEKRLLLKEWETRKKMPWEEAIDPAKVHDVRYGMTVFALEGCAACHRLQGFQSNVGFAAEKDNKGKLSFDTLYQEKQWFTRLIPEMFSSQQLVKVLEAQAEEIDKRIVDDVRQGSLLEEIESQQPQLLYSFYAPFRYAERAKNHFYQEQLDRAQTAQEKQEIQNNWNQWKKRVHRVLLMYIQEYGLGRLVGPRPNWAGVYRSDEWLMEHFRNPSALVPKSIMPVFPFDDTKFYALTYMLDEVGKKNRDAVHAIWQHQGFSPQQAYNIHCSQCHGNFLAGNGPVSEWIYPVPKNLRNATFLRSLTRERVAESIHHGVKGTPMPPWGEAPTDKPTADGIPILTTEEIDQLVDWLFATLSGGTGIRESQEVPKWQYTPQDVWHELLREGNLPKLDKQANDNKDKVSWYGLPTGEGLLASLQPVLAAQKDFAEIFDKRSPPFSQAVDTSYYYIRKKYYTPINLTQGRLFFEENCAACHGRDADGAGLRAGAMQESKPRMLTNIKWLDTHDDIYLLRAIKYGVPGTAMTPWGDLTSSLQRLQLVMYIRSLSEEQQMREEVDTVFYETFGHEQMTVEQARIPLAKKINQLKQDYKKLQRERKQAEKTLEKGPKQASGLYQKELMLRQEMEEAEWQDQQLLSIKNTLKKISGLFQSLAKSIITQKFSNDFLELFLQLVKTVPGHYQVENDQLVIVPDPQQEKERQTLTAQMNSELDKQLRQLEEHKLFLQGKISSPMRNTEIYELETKIQALQKLKRDFTSHLREAADLRDNLQKLKRRQDDSSS